MTNTVHRFLCLLTGLLMLLCTVFETSSPVLAASGRIKELRIADSRGDWGPPTPYQHYPRGPGYLRAAWIFDTLIWKDHNGLVPALAESWSFDPSAMRYIFKLNPRARWHDGRPVTSSDVAFTIEYFKKHPSSWCKPQWISAAQTPDERTVIITLAEPYAPFLETIAGVMPILPRHIWERVSDPQNFMAPEAFIGSGPYMFKDFDRTRGSYLYEAFDGYYQGRPLADRLIYLRAGASLPALLSKEADLADIQPDMAAAAKQRGLVVIKNEHGWNKKLMLNHTREPLNSKIFRQALAYALDQEEIIAKAHRGFGLPASYGLLSVDHDLYNPAIPSYPHDTQKARQLIESLGYERDEEGFYAKNGQPLHLELLASAVSLGGQNASDRDGEVVKKQFEEAGIRIKLVAMEQTAADSLIKNWQFDLAVSGHGGLTGDPAGLNEYILPEEGADNVNSARFGANAELTTLLREQIREMDPEKRKQMIFAVQELYAEELPAISLYYPEFTAAYAPEKGVAWFYTKGGVSGRGIPLPQNKMALIPR